MREGEFERLLERARSIIRYTGTSNSVEHELCQSEPDLPEGMPFLVRVAAEMMEESLGDS